MRVLSLFTLARRSFWLLFGGIWLIGGVGLLGGGVGLARQELAYRHGGERVGAVVLSKDLRRATKDSGTSYAVTYRFTDAEGRAVQGHGPVSIATWESLREGDTVEVEYVPRDPTANRLAGGGDPAAAVIMLVMGLGFGGIGGFLFLRGARRVLRERRLRDHGTLGEATITAVEPTNVSFNRQQQWTVHYRFADHLGRPQEGTSAYLFPAEAQTWKPGDTGKIRFDRERPGDSIWLGSDPA